MGELGLDEEPTSTTVLQYIIITWQQQSREEKNTLPYIDFLTQVLLFWQKHLEQSKTSQRIQKIKQFYYPDAHKDWNIDDENCELVVIMLLSL